MADTLRFELVSPERKLASVDALQVQIPGVAGDFTAMPRHAPFLTTLRPGVVRVVASGETTEFIVTGGFAEVSPDGTTILAERAVTRDTATLEMVQDLVRGAERALADAGSDGQMDAAQRLRDCQRLGAILGF